MCRGPLGTSRVAVGRLRNCNWPLQKKQLSRARTRVYEPHHRRTASSVNLKGSVRRAPPRCCSGGSSSSSCRLPGRRSGGSRRGERCEWAEVPLLADRISSRTCDRPIHGLYSNKMALITSDCGEMSGATVCVLGGRMRRLSAGGVVFDAQVRCGVHAGNNCSVSTGRSMWCSCRQQLQCQHRSVARAMRAGPPPCRPSRHPTRRACAGSGGPVFVWAIGRIKSRDEVRRWHPLCVGWNAMQWEGGRGMVQEIGPATGWVHLVLSP